MPRFIYNHVRDKHDKSRDLIFQVDETTASVPLPAIFDLRTKSKSPIVILDQQSLGACCPNEISNALRFCLQQETTSTAPVTLFQPSRLFIYYYARILDGSSVLVDSGITISNGIKSVELYGVPPENLWPYNIAGFTFTPSPQAIAAAKINEIGYKAMSVPLNLTSIKQAISAGCPVILGIQVYSSLEAETTLKTGNIPLPNLAVDTYLGGHCVGLYGWNDATQMFLMENSWGTEVGINGWFEIPYAYITNPNYTSDLWTITYFK